MSREYKEVAKKLGVKYLCGRWGFRLTSDLPDRHKVLSVKLVPLDGWITEPKELEHIMRERGLEL